MKKLVTALAPALVVVTLLSAGPLIAGTLVKLENPPEYRLEAVGFELPRSTEIHIEAVGRLAVGGEPGWFEGLFRGGEADGESLSVYAWILDSETRRPVWFMDYRDTRRVDERLREIEDSVQLTAGRYELYFFSGQRWLVNYDADEERDEERPWWVKIWSGDADGLADLREDLEQCHVTLSADGLSADELERFDPTGGLPDAVVRRNRMGDSQLDAVGLELDRPMEFRLYGIAERSRGSREAADYAWIVDSATREQVWTTPRSLDDAGGARKNRLIDEEVQLEAGSYVLFYGSDDSHSFDAFNNNPPYDPLNWGITLLPGAGFDATAFRTFDPAERERAPLIELTAVGDRELRNQPFRLNQAADLHLLAVGEYYDGDDIFVDGAWILGLRTRETVWKMTHDNTVGAGGSEKNRRFDGLVHLEPGDYVLYYASDGSHSAENWNAAAPFEPDGWGVRLRSARNLDGESFTLLTEEALRQDDGVLVSIVGVGDDERRRERFTLDEPARVKIYALGEGTGGSMYDYGYIVDERTGRAVWEMEWRETAHAGGADKNRLLDDEILMQPGTYEVVFETDDSHSFAGWNAARPSDPMSWGITIRRVAG